MTTLEDVTGTTDRHELLPVRIRLTNGAEIQTELTMVEIDTWRGHRGGAVCRARSGAAHVVPWHGVQFVTIDPKGD